MKPMHVMTVIGTAILAILFLEGISYAQYAGEDIDKELDEDTARTAAPGKRETNRAEADTNTKDAGEVDIAAEQPAGERKNDVDDAPDGGAASGASSVHRGSVASDTADTELASPDNTEDASADAKEPIAEDAELVEGEVLALDLDSGSGDRTTALEDRLKFNGFFSVGAGVTLDESAFLADYVGNEGYDNDLSFLPDTSYGFQVNFVLHEQVEVVSQLVGRGASSFIPGFEWAYIQFGRSTRGSLKVGRMRRQQYLLSDALEVGYSYHWVRPPTAFYQASVNSMEGLSTDFVNSWNKVSLSLNAFFGRARGLDAMLSEENQMDIITDHKITTGGSALISFDDTVELRLGIMYSKVGLNWPVDERVLTELPAAGVVLPMETGERLVADVEADYLFNSASVSLDLTHFFWLSEFAFAPVLTDRMPGLGEALGEDVADYLRENDIPFESTENRRWVQLYSSLGVRFFNFTPHATYAVHMELQDDRDLIEHHLTGGVRYDLPMAVALKGEFTQVLDTSDEGFRKSDAKVLSFAIDAAF